MNFEYYEQKMKELIAKHERVSTTLIMFKLKVNFECAEKLKEKFCNLNEDKQKS